MPKVIPDLFWLLANSVGRAALGATLKPGMGEEWRGTLEQYVSREGKWSKFQVAYSPVAPPPVFWEYNCGQCWAFQREAQQCRWVSEQGWPNPGIIHPQGYCVVWMPLEGEKPLNWVGRMPWFIRELAPAFP